VTNPALREMKENSLAFRFIGKWNRSPDGDSPALWMDEETGDVILQGWKIDDQEEIAELLETSERSEIPENETVIRFPADMVNLLREVADGGFAGSDPR